MLAGQRVVRMEDRHSSWAVVLAAGEGSRLSLLTTTPSGLSVPKQFCSLRGGASLLHEALKRAGTVATLERTCTIVAAQHRRWWNSPLSLLPAANVIVQPQNRGTGNGILLSLLRILERDPNARLVLLPSDHHVRSEAKLARALRRATAQLSSPSGGVVLLGIEPEESDPELGYILPGNRQSEGNFAVERFVEKPPVTLAHELIGRGGLWNAFIIAATGRALLGLFERRCPEIVREMRWALTRDAQSATGDQMLAELYEHLPALDFSRVILEGQEMYLRVLPVPPCGWSDLGTPKRVAKTLRGLPFAQRRLNRTHAGSAYLDLAAQHERLRLAAGQSFAAVQV
jgi:mannose-1-phosphate guanylyltransferase